jgi:hypothetical protein
LSWLFWIWGSLELFPPGWPWTMVLLISVSQVARITGVSHWRLTWKRSYWFTSVPFPAPSKTCSFPCSFTHFCGSPEPCHTSPCENQGPRYHVTLNISNNLMLFLVWNDSSLSSSQTVRAKAQTSLLITISNPRATKATLNLTWALRRNSPCNQGSSDSMGQENWGRDWWMNISWRSRLWIATQNLKGRCIFEAEKRK